jgi:hypothetical protein
MQGGRAPLLLLALALAAGLAWATGLFDPAPPPERLEPVDAPIRPGQPPMATPEPGGASPPSPARSRWVARIGVVDRDEGPPPAPEGESWLKQSVTVRAAPQEPWKGADLLEAIGERLYVRVKSAEELAQLREQTLAPRPPPQPMPLPMAVRRLEQAGWRAVVQEPVLFLAWGPVGPSRPPGTPPPDRPR